MRNGNAKTWIWGTQPAEACRVMMRRFSANKYRKRMADPGAVRQAACAVTVRMKTAMNMALALMIGLFVVVATAWAAPGDLVLDKKTRATGFDPVVFPHWVHRIHFRCSVCHEQIFEMKKGANEITMEKINQRESCGKCHNGETAFEAGFQACSRCHQAAAKKRR